MREKNAPLVDIYLRDRATGERLYDGNCTVITPNGETIITFSGDYSISGTFSDKGELTPLPPGDYCLVELRAPRSPVDPPEDPSDPCYEAPYHKADAVSFAVTGSHDRQTIELLHDRKPASSEEQDECIEESSCKESKGLLLRAARQFGNLIFGVRRQKRRSITQKRFTLCRLWIAALIASLVLGLWIMAPIFWMTAFGLASIFSKGLGLVFAAENLADYFTGGYLLAGWKAVSILDSAYTVPILVPITCTLATTAVLIATVRKVNKRIDRALTQNDLLDSLPQAAGHNECGSARFIRDADEIAETLKTCDASIPCNGLDYAGPVFGFLNESLARTALRVMRSDAVYLQSQIKALRPGSSCHVAPRSHMEPIVTAEKFVYSDEDENTLIIGDTRAGKTRRQLLATIDLLTRSLKESLLILDPKGELYALTCELVEERGIPTNRIDFRFPRYSKRWNPMQLIVEAAGKARIAQKTEDESALLEAYDAMNSAAEDLVLMIMPKENDIGPNTFFNQGARSYIKSSMLFVACWDNCPDNQRSLATVSRLIDNYGSARTTDTDNAMSEKLTPYIWMLDYLPRNHPAFEAFSNARSANDKERSQFVTTALGALQDYRDSNIAAMTSDTDVPLKQLGLKRSVTYLIIPHEKSTYSAFATLYIQQAYQALIEESTLHGGRLPFRVNFLCEEFGQIPPLTDLDKKLSTSLSAGIRWIIVLQSIAQLITVYGRGYDDIVKTNCENKIIIKTTDAENTGKWFSALAGKYTIALEGGSISGKRFALWKDSSSTNSRLGARELIDPSEVSRWRADYGALMHRGASNGVYVIPLPDVSQTPTQKILGLGDPEHNRLKTERVLYGSEVPVREIIDPWSPELNKMREKTLRGERYTDEEKRIAEAVFVDRLLKRRDAARKRSKPNAAASSAKRTSAQRYGCLLDPISMKTTPVALVSSNEYLGALQEHPTWERIEMAEEHSVKNALGQRKRTISQRREQARSEASASRTPSHEPVAAKAPHLPAEKPEERSAARITGRPDASESTKADFKARI